MLVGSRYKNTLKIKEVQLYTFPLDNYCTDDVTALQEI